jgi:hypothetical protein
MSYRQELLDITAQEGFPEDVKWPELWDLRSLRSSSRWRAARRRLSRRCR